MISRNFLRELRPLFRMLDEPLTRGSPVYWNSRSPFEIPFVSQSKLQPAVDITEEGNNYVVEAELPGVKKDDVQVHIGDSGHSIIIEGKVSSRSRAAPQQSGAESTTSEQPAQDRPAAISLEREFTGQSSFTRTISLPHPVDTNNVSAKLEDGILLVTVPKAEQAGRVKVDID